MELWQMIVEVARQEFSDVPDLAEALRVAMRLLLAALLGGILGYERESKGKAAGIRTHMLVAMGCALFVLAPSMRGYEHDAMSRVIQGVAAGIGFLGAGTILKGRDLQHVHGLTSAAGIWMTAAIGIAVGMGREATAVISTLLALIVFFLMPKLTPAPEDEEEEEEEEEHESRRD